jgi:hypothetical protein
MIAPNLHHNRGELAPTGITTWNPTASTEPNQEPAQGIQVLPHMLSLPTIFGMLCALHSSIPNRCTLFRLCFMRRFFCTIPQLVLSMEMTPVCLLHKASKILHDHWWLKNKHPRRMLLMLTIVTTCPRTYVMQWYVTPIHPDGHWRPEKYFIRLQYISAASCFKAIVICEMNGKVLTDKHSTASIN